MLVIMTLLSYREARAIYEMAAEMDIRYLKEHNIMCN